MYKSFKKVMEIRKANLSVKSNLLFPSFVNKKNCLTFHSVVSQVENRNVASMSSKGTDMSSKDTKCTKLLRKPRKFEKLLSLWKATYCFLHLLTKNCLAFNSQLEKICRQFFFSVF